MNDMTEESKPLSMKDNDEGSENLFPEKLSMDELVDRLENISNHTDWTINFKAMIMRYLIEVINAG